MLHLQTCEKLEANNSFPITFNEVIDRQEYMTFPDRLDTQLELDHENHLVHTERMKMYVVPIVPPWTIDDSKITFTVTRYYF